MLVYCLARTGTAEKEVVASTAKAVLRLVSRSKNIFDIDHYKGSLLKKDYA
jgi:hypothetical protein